MATETYDQLQESRTALLLSLGNAHKKMLEQVQQVSELTLELHETTKDLDAARKAIGELRSQVVYWKTMCMAVELLGPESVREVEQSCKPETAG